jgi:hypothetical protein
MKRGAGDGKGDLLPADIGYLNKEISVFRERIEKGPATGFDAAAVLSVVTPIEGEGQGR